MGRGFFRLLKSGMDQGRFEGSWVLASNERRIDQEADRRSEGGGCLAPEDGGDAVSSPSPRGAEVSEAPLDGVDPNWPKAEAVPRTLMLDYRLIGLLSWG